MLIKTEKVSRCFPVADGPDFYALKEVSIDVKGPSLTILRGKSGSGKTTLMNLIGALDLPSEGKVYFEDRDLGALSEKERENLRREKIGFVFQSVSLIPMMTAYENVEFALRLAGYDKNRKSRCEECLKMVGLYERMHHMPQELSGGEQQRVAIARAIAHRPSVILADEPTAELDSHTSLQVMKIFQELVEKEKITVVMTTHDVSLMNLGDTVFALQDGQLIETVRKGET